MSEWSDLTNKQLHSTENNKLMFIDKAPVHPEQLDYEQKCKKHEHIVLCSLH